MLYNIFQLKSPYVGPKDSSSKDGESSWNEKSFLFSGKVIIGISIVMALAAAISYFSSSHSASPIIQTFPQVTKSVQSKVDRSIVLVQNEFGWNGTSGGPTITITKGDTVRITIINAGNMAHNFGIAKISTETENLLKKVTGIPANSKLGNLSYSELSAMPCPGCQPVYSGAHIDAFMPPLTQQVIFFKATEAGNFKYFCMVRGHLWLGMIGSLVVQSPSQLGET